MLKIGIYNKQSGQKLFATEKRPLSSVKEEDETQVCIKSSDNNTELEDDKSGTTSELLIQKTQSELPDEIVASLKVDCAKSIKTYEKAFFLPLIPNATKILHEEGYRVEHPYLAKAADILNGMNNKLSWMPYTYVMAVFVSYLPYFHPYWQIQDKQSGLCPDVSNGTTALSNSSIPLNDLIDWVCNQKFGDSADYFAGRDLLKAMVVSAPLTLTALISLFPALPSKTLNRHQSDYFYKKLQICKPNLSSFPMVVTSNLTRWGINLILQFVDLLKSETVDNVMAYTYRFLVPLGALEILQTSLNTVEEELLRRLSTPTTTDKEKMAILVALYAHNNMSKKDKSIKPIDEAAYKSFKSLCDSHRIKVEDVANQYNTRKVERFLHPNFIRSIVIGIPTALLVAEFTNFVMNSKSENDDDHNKTLNTTIVVALMICRPLSALLSKPWSNFMLRKMLKDSSAKLNNKEFDTIYRCDITRTFCAMICNAFLQAPRVLKFDAGTLWYRFWNTSDTVITVLPDSIAARAAKRSADTLATGKYIEWTRTFLLGCHKSLTDPSQNAEASTSAENAANQVEITFEEVTTKYASMLLQEEISRIATNTAALEAPGLLQEVVVESAQSTCDAGLTRESLAWTKSPCVIS